MKLHIVRHGEPVQLKPLGSSPQVVIKMCTNRWLCKWFLVYHTLILREVKPLHVYKPISYRGIASDTGLSLLELSRTLKASHQKFQRPASGPFNALSWAFLPSCAQGYSSCPTNTTWQVGAEMCIMYSTGHSLTYPTIFTKYDTLNPCIECAAKVTLRFGSSVSGRDVQQLRNSLSGASQVPFPLRPSPLPVHMQHGLLTVRCIHKLSKKKGKIKAHRSPS